MLEVLNVILDVLGILAIVCLGAFVVVLIGDLILSTFDGHEGVFFHRSKKTGTTQAYSPAPVKEEEPQQVLQQQPTVIPYYQEMEQQELEAEENKKQPEVVSAVDFQKAAEEQKMLQSRAMIKEPARKPALETVPQPVFTEIEDEDDDNELADAIKETTQVALNQIALETELKKQQEELERNRRAEEEARKQAEDAKREAEKARKEAEEAKRAAKRKPEVVYVKEPEKKEDPSVKQLKKLREDIFSLRRSAFMDLQELKDTDHANEIKQTQREYNRAMKEKLKELDELKITHEKLDREKQELLKYKKVALQRETELQRVEQENAELKKYKRAALEKETELDRIAEEKEKLAKQVEELKQIKESAGKKPYYTKEYYLKRLDSLNDELKEVEKDLRANKREFTPLQRIKKSYERDQEKLRRKEAIVAKQKVAIYGVKSSANIDPKRKEKLDEDVKQLNELKESVFHCDQVLKQNKDRYPVLEKANKLLTKSYERLISDIDNVKAAIAWYNENEDK